MGFAVAELPYVTLWKNLTAVEEGYVTGLEPGTSFPYTRRLEREAGRVPKLKPGETRRFAIDIGLHATAEAVRTVEDQITRIQDGRPRRLIARRNADPYTPRPKTGSRPPSHRRSTRDRRRG